MTLVVSPYGFTPILAAYTGDQLSNLVEVGSAIASCLTFSADAGTVYHFALDGVNGRSGAFSLELLTAPANDDFTNRFLLVGPSALASANNKLATSESGEVLASGASGKTLWWSWTAPSNATVAINLASASFSSVFDESSSFTRASIRIRPLGFRFHRPRFDQPHAGRQQFGAYFLRTVSRPLGGNYQLHLRCHQWGDVSRGR